MDNKEPSVRIVIADDHTIFRDGLRRLLEAEPELEVVGEAADGAEAVSQTRELSPDILLLDLAMPRVPGMDVLRELSSKDEGLQTKIIVLTAAVERIQIVQALQMGARGVVMKEAATQLLMKAIRTVMAGQYWIGREARRRHRGLHANQCLGRQTAAQLRLDETRNGNPGYHCRRPQQQGNCAQVLAQRRHGEASPHQHLRQGGRCQPAGACACSPSTTTSRIPQRLLRRDIEPGDLPGLMHPAAGRGIQPITCWLVNRVYGPLKSRIFVVNDSDKSPRFVFLSV